MQSSLQQTLQRLGQQAITDRQELKETLIALLELTDFQPVYALADRIRAQEKGDQVWIRAILEFSNYCRRSCAYCGLNCHNRQIERYRMTAEEMIATAIQANAAGYHTLVMQSGEDPYFNAERLGAIIQAIKKQTKEMAITVSCGEQPKATYAYWRECGANRYLLKHETADPELYQKLHPCGTLANRIQCLKTLKALGYETGSGFMIGLPGQTTATIAEDLLLLKEIGCDMAGIGPFIPHPATPLAHAESGSTELTTRAVALARILLPQANLPATTALGVMDQEAKHHAFSSGANVVMKKVTPQQYKTLYEIYPAQFAPTNIMAERQELEAQIKALDRIPI